MSLDELRVEIDLIDAELLRLINRRARTALRAGELKQAAGLPVRDADRERDVLARAVDANGGPLSNGAISKIFRLIIDESRNLEMTVASLPTGKVREVS